MATYLNEQRVTTLAQASVLADEFVLTHRGIQENRYGDQGSYRTPVKGRMRPRVTGPNTVSLPRDKKDQWTSLSLELALSVQTYYPLDTSFEL